MLIKDFCVSALTMAFLLLDYMEREVEGELVADGLKMFRNKELRVSIKEEPAEGCWLLGHLSIPHSLYQSFGIRGSLLLTNCFNEQGRGQFSTSITYGSRVVSFLYEICRKNLKIVNTGCG